jgi:ribonuclease P protein component
MATERRHRFSRRDRVCRRAEFLRIYADGRRAGANGFVVYLLPCATERSRLGISVSKRVGNAVKRNRVKRRLRETFRLNRHRLPGCFDLVINARTEVADMPFTELAEAFLGAVRRAARARPKRVESSTERPQ